MKKICLLLLCVSAIVTGANAQVTIGSINEPEKYSILQIDGNEGGVRLPQLTTADKEALEVKFAENMAGSEGLLIYSVDDQEVQFWDGEKWVAAKAGEAVTLPTEPWQVSGGTDEATDNTEDIYQMGWVTIGSADAIDSSVAFKVVAEDRGILVPRLTEAQRDAIADPVDGLLIYNIDEDCFNYYNVKDEEWQSLCGKMGKATIDEVYCDDIRVFGNYIEGVEMTMNERINIPVEVTKIGSYDITVTVMNNGVDNGYMFIGSGTFMYTGRQTITLTAQGTPQAAHFNPTPPPAVGDNILIHINGVDFDGCNDFVIPVTPALADYSVSCGSAAVKGIYTMLPDQTNSDDATHYIEVTVDVSSLGAGNAASGWSGETNKVSGVQFRGSGNFTTTGSNTVRLYAVAGTKPTTLDPITLTMTFQTKNGVVDCSVVLRAAYTPKKIVSFGLTDIYGYNLRNGASQPFMASDYNFGSKDYSTVKMVDDFDVATYAPGYTKVGAFAIRWAGPVGAINIAANWTQIMNEKPDIVISTWNADAITPATAQLIMQYLNAGGIFLHFAENNPGAMVSAIFGVLASSISSNRAGAPATTTLANHDDPFITGPFQPAGRKTLGGLDLGGDTETTMYYVEGLPQNGMIVYGYNRSAAERVAVFRATGQNYVYFGEGGFFTNDGNTTWLNAITEPFATTGAPEHRPAMRATSTGYPNGAYNSFFWGNMLTWAIDLAQFKGINSGN